MRHARARLRRYTRRRKAVYGRLAEADRQRVNDWTERAYPHTTVKALEDQDGFLADCDAARGAITVGRTEHEALEEMRSALVDWASLMLWRGQPLPDIGAAARNDGE